ncbi:MAG: PfkB family carbohydrate kinase [Candidatus Kariarchaeaceae archaeon]|jgi:adenosine kinase
MHQNTLVVGSIGFDIVFSIEPTFRQEIPLVDGKIENVNMTFVASSNQTVHGGTGSNIAYSHVLLTRGGVVIFSAVGKNDFDSTMGRKLVQMGVTDKTVKYEKEETARSYQISDSRFEQMIIWQPNAYRHIGEIDLNETIDANLLTSCKNAIFSPGTPESTLRHLQNYREVNVEGNAIFDPGQMVNHYDRETFVQCCELANVLIVNETEMLKVQSAFNLSVDSVNKLDTTVIITKGPAGAVIVQKGITLEIPAFTPPRQVIETTGAGDAFRGGLLAALQLGENLEYGCKVGSIMGAEAVGYPGPQEHKLTWDDVKKRI